MNVQARVKSDWSCVNENENILSVTRMKEYGSSSISCTVYPHCSELVKVQGVQLKTMSAKGDFSKMKNWSLQGKQRLWGIVILFWSPNDMFYQQEKCRTNQGPGNHQETSDLRERTNGETGGQAHGERKAQLKKIHSDAKILCPDEDPMHVNFQSSTFRRIAMAFES